MVILVSPTSPLTARNAVFFLWPSAIVGLTVTDLTLPAAFFSLKHILCPGHHRPSPLSFNTSRPLDALAAEPGKTWWHESLDPTDCHTKASDQEEELHDILESHKEQKASETKRQLEGVISRVGVKWCCHCMKTTDFSNKECPEKFCKHQYCSRCRNFKRSG